QLAKRGVRHALRCRNWDRLRDFKIYPKTGRKANRPLPLKSLHPRDLGWSKIWRLPDSTGAHKSTRFDVGKLLRIRLQRRRLWRRRTRPARPIRRFLLDRLGLGFGFFLRLARGGLGAFALVALVPVARDLARQLAISQPERQRQRERDRPEEKRERRRHDVRRDTELLQRHEDREQNDAAPPDARKRPTTVNRT